MSLVRSMWSNVQVKMQSALAVALTITGITKANPAVVTYTGTDPSNGDYLIVSAQGMTQLGFRVVRAANVNAGANTFECEGIDSTDFDTFTSGSAQVITYGTTAESLTNVQASGGEAEETDATTMHDSINQIEYGNFSALQYTFGSQWDPGNAFNAAAFAASQIKADRAFLISFANGRKAAFSGKVAYAGVPAGAAKGVAESPLKVTSRGFPSYFTS